MLWTVLPFWFQHRPRWANQNLQGHEFASLTHRNASDASTGYKRQAASWFTALQLLPGQSPSEQATNNEHPAEIQSKQCKQTSGFALREDRHGPTLRRKDASPSRAPWRSQHVAHR